jgi:hypothetical protein
MSHVFDRRATLVPRVTQRIPSPLGVTADPIKFSDSRDWELTANSKASRAAAKAPPRDPGERRALSAQSRAVWRLV